MTQIQSTLNQYPHESITVEVPDKDLNLETASAIAKNKARSIDSNAMMLSYHSGKTGEFWPAYDCGGNGRPPWIVFAEARGYNLLIDINKGEFEFFYLRI